MPPGMDIVDSSGPKQPSPYMLTAQGTNFAGALLAAAPVPKNPQAPQPEAALTQPQYGPCPPQSPRASLNASISLSGLSELVKHLPSEPCTPERNELATQLSQLVLSPDEQQKASMDIEAFFGATAALLP